MTFHRVLKFIFLNYLSLFKGSISEQADGEQYIKKLLDKENIAERPESLLFTAPYRICEGGCDKEDDPNFVMAFPMFIGNKGKAVYKEIYSSATRKLFPLRPSPQTYTTCPPEKPMANLNTKSTMYPGYSIITTQSTLYPGYTKNSGATSSTGFPGYAELMKTLSTAFPTYGEPMKTSSTAIPTYAEIMKTSSTAIPTHAELMKIWSTGYPELRSLFEEAVRARFSHPEEYGAKYPEQANEDVYRNAIRSGEMQQFEHPLFRRTVSMGAPSPPPLRWRPTQSLKNHQNTYIADVVNKRHNKLSLLFGYRPVLPIRNQI